MTDSSNVGTNIKPWVMPAQGQVVNQVVKLRQQATIDRQLLTMVIIQSVRTSFFPSISLSLSLCHMIIIVIIQPVCTPLPPLLVIPELRTHSKGKDREGETERDMVKIV